MKKKKKILEDQKSWNLSNPQSAHVNTVILMESNFRNGAMLYYVLCV